MENKPDIKQNDKLMWIEDVNKKVWVPIKNYKPALKLKEE